MHAVLTGDKYLNDDSRKTEGIMSLQQKKYGIAVVGGGASGLFAALCAAWERNRMTKKTETSGIVVLEKNDRVGKKLLTTGNGRCNLTNLEAAFASYWGMEKDFAQEVISRCPPQKVMEMFHKLGVDCRVEGEGRVYPASGQASSVLDMLRARLELEGVEQRCGATVTSLQREKGGYLLTDAKGERLYASRVILAAGGRAAPSTGSSGEGYFLAKQLGHGVTPVFPALVQLKTDPRLVKALKGMKCSAAAVLAADGVPIRKTEGEVLFTEYGLSGICIFQLSRAAGEFFATGRLSGLSRRSISVWLDLLPDLPEEKTGEWLQERRNNLRGLAMEMFFCGMLNKKIGQEILKSAVEETFQRRVDSLTNRELQVLADRIRHWEFPVVGTMSWQQAQVTAGGLCTDGFNSATMESKYAPGFYACGEVLDVDGDCGGYNLQWAWSSGFAAGTSAVQSLIEKRGGTR